MSGRERYEQRAMDHLSDEAFSGLLMGEALETRAQAHLMECARCREELRRFKDSVAGFSMATLDWSERRSEQLPALRPAAGQKAGQAWGGSLQPVWTWGLATLLALGVAIPVTIHENGLRNAHVASGETDEDAAGLNSPEQIAKDNQLMADVNYELSRSEAVLAGASSGGKVKAERRN